MSKTHLYSWPYTAWTREDITACALLKFMELIGVVEDWVVLDTGVAASDYIEIAFKEKHDR